MTSITNLTSTDRSTQSDIIQTGLPVHTNITSIDGFT